MKKIKYAIAICIAMGIYNVSVAQKTKSNLVKVNLAGLALGNYGLQYERVLNKRWSFALGYRFQPKSKLPLTGLISSGNNAEADEAINSVRLSNYAITPEFRFYLGKKGYGRGFYFAPFYRLASFSATGVNVDYTSSTPGGTPGSIDLQGTIKGNSVGLLMGSQWKLGKSVALDWFILGPHYGAGTGILSGKSSVALGTQEQASLSDVLASIDVPFVDETYSVSSTGASINFKGPWAGIRAGLSLGIAF